MPGDCGLINKVNYGDLISVTDLIGRSVSKKYSGLALYIYDGGIVRKSLILK